MVHIPAKFRENTSMRFLVSAKTKRDGRTDRQTDGRTDRQTDGRTDGGHCNISHPGPSAPREIKISLKPVVEYQLLWLSISLTK